MANTLEDFIGTYRIRHGQGSFGVIEPGFLLAMGTGEYGDPPSDGIRIGVAIVDPQSHERVLPAPGHPPAFLYLVDGTLNGTCYWLDEPGAPQLLTYQVSLFALRLRDGGLYKAPTLTIAIGDPQNAGVWGADDEASG